MAAQVQFAAHRMRLRFALYCATEGWRPARDTDAGFELLCRVSAAQRKLERFEAKLDEIARLKIAITQARAARGESHLPPWQPSAEDLAVLGNKSRRADGRVAPGRAQHGGLAEAMRCSGS